MTVDPSGLVLVAFDGTNNSPQDRTNVRLFYEEYKGTALYVNGVGSDGDRRGSAFGNGLNDRMDWAFEWLTCKLAANPSDRDVDIVGFSRGATAARAFANKITDSGLLLKNGASIRFIGVWDTVAAIGYASNTGGLKLGLPSPFTGKAFQAMSIDENRSQFKLERLPGAREVWFAGVHSDVGGGYSRLESGLSNTTMRWMIFHAKATGVPTRLSEKNFYSTKSTTRMHNELDPTQNLTMYTTQTAVTRTVGPGDLIRDIVKFGG